MNRGGQQVAVQGVEAQVIPVIRVLLPHFVEQNDKLHRVFQRHRQATILSQLNIHAGDENGLSDHVFTSDEVGGWSG